VDEGQRRPRARAVGGGGVNLGLEGQRVLVGGSSRGIGRAIAAAFLEEGADVALTGRGAADLEAARAELATTHPRRTITAASADLRDPEAAGACVEGAATALGGLDVVVANAGRGQGPTIDAPGAAAWRELVDENLFTAVHVCEAALSRSPPPRALLLVGSIAGLEFHPAPLPYSAAKAALVRYARDLARRTAAYGVRVNLVAPGNVAFPGGRWAEREAEDPVGVRELLEREVPMGRFGTPEEIAAAAVFLCSARSSFTTGAVLAVDGGQRRG
jgi:3-oxoacyl-[acyl-carrier protein] reductase